MKKAIFALMALILGVLTVGCSKTDQPAESKIICEVGNTGKVVSSCNVLTGKVGSSRTLASDMTFWYCPDCSKITSYDLSEGIPGMLMNDYSFVLHGDEVVDNNGEVSTTTYEYGNEANAHRQPSVSFFNSLNLLSLDVLRPFLTAGYFGKGPDRFEVSSHEPGSAVAVDRTYSVELDAEGKINVLHEKYGEGSYKDYSFTYAEIKQ